MYNHTTRTFRLIAQEVRQDPTVWTQNALARDKDGKELDEEMIHEPEARSWCIDGLCALYNVPTTYLSRHAQKLGWANEVEWNDAPDRQPHEVAKFLDDTAAELEAMTWPDLHSLAVS